MALGEIVMRSKFFASAITVVTILGVLPSVFCAGSATGAGWGTAQLIEADNSQDAFGVEMS